MLRFGVVLVVGLVGVLGTLAGKDPPAGDLVVLQGNWKPLSVQYEGKPQMTPDEMTKVTAVFDQAEYHLYYADKTKTPPTVLKLAVMNVTIDSTTTPKSIAFEYAAGPLKGQKRHGIYEVAGNELKLCYGPAEKPKPTQFAAPDKSGYFHEVWARQPLK
jgi:uncharacterized protein (TIGR03067 family)